MPDPNQSESTVTTTEQAQPESLTPQQESREALYQKLYGQNQQQPQDTTQSNQVTPAATAETPDYKALFDQLSTQVQSLIAAQKPAETVKPAAPQEDWFSLLQAGKRTEAEQVLKDYVAQGAQQKIIQETLVQAMELNRMEREIEDFNNSVRANNSDMLDVEDLISLKAKESFDKVLPTVKNNKEYVEAYKRAVNSSVESIRNVLRRTRAAAKNEALTTKREVLASTTMQPNDIQRREETNGQQQPPAEQEMQSPTDYLAARRANMSRLSGMAS